MNQYSMMAPHMKDFADQGLSRSLFYATNPTSGTGIASEDASTARSATAGLMNVFNDTADGVGGNVIIPIRLWLRETAINTTASNLSFAIYVDGKQRWSSGGTAITEVPTITSGEADFTEPTSNAMIHFGELVLSAATTSPGENKLWDREVSTTIGAADDTYDIWFGDGPSLFPAAVAATGHYEDNIFIRPACWIRPQSSLIFQSWGASQAADPAFEFEFWYLETPNAN